MKSLHACSNLKEGAIPDVAPIWPVCLLFEIFYELHLSTNGLWCRLEGTRVSVWTCVCPRLVESGVGTELERNVIIALAFGLKPTLRSNYISHALLPARLPARSALRSAHMPCPRLTYRFSEWYIPIPKLTYSLWVVYTDPQTGIQILVKPAQWHYICIFIRGWYNSQCHNNLKWHMCRWNNSGMIAAYHSENLYAGLGSGIYHSENLYVSLGIGIY